MATYAMVAGQLTQWWPGTGDAAMIVWVVVADYGLNGAGVLAVFAHEPTQAEVDKLVRAPVYRDTGYSGTDCEQWEVTP